MASAVQSDVAGLAFEGNPDLAEVPSKLPFANTRLFVDACISTKNARTNNGKALHEC